MQQLSTDSVHCFKGFGQFLPGIKLVLLGNYEYLPIHINDFLAQTQRVGPYL